MADRSDRAAAAAENTPLLPSSSSPKPKRSVTFGPDVPSSRPPQRLARQVRPTHPAFSTGAVNPTVLAALNNRLRRRNSQGSIPNVSLAPTAPRLGPQRSSKTAQKLKLLPEPSLDAEHAGEDHVDEESGREVYSQFTRIKDPTARRDAARLGKADRERLPRVTAYCTANRYARDLLVRFLKGRGKRRGANPKLIDECIYTPYSYRGADAGAGPVRTEDSGVGGLDAGAEQPRHGERHSADLGAIMRGYDPGVSEVEVEADADADAEGDGSAGGFPSLSSREEEEGNTPDFDTTVHTSEVFLFDYGVVVVWGMSLAEEQRFLKELTKFEVEPLPMDQIETEEFNFYYTREYQPRIYNDFITLRDKRNYMTKLAISHALAQSVKTSLFEELIASTIDTCKEIPHQISLTGKVLLSRSEINMQIGELFALRIDIHLNGSVLDTPEIFWLEPHLEPVYQAVRSYLEMDQRVGVLTDRLDVIADLLAVLKDLLTYGHGEKLEWIVIILIAAEIFVALVNIIVDLYVGI